MVTERSRSAQPKQSHEYNFQLCFSSKLTDYFVVKTPRNDVLYQNMSLRAVVTEQSRSAQPKQSHEYNFQLRFSSKITDYFVAKLLVTTVIKAVLGRWKISRIVKNCLNFINYSLC